MQNTSGVLRNFPSMNRSQMRQKYPLIQKQKHKQKLSVRLNYFKKLGHFFCCLLSCILSQNSLLYFLQQLIWNTATCIFTTWSYLNLLLPMKVQMEQPFVRGTTSSSLGVPQSFSSSLFSSKTYIAHFSPQTHN